MKDVKDLLIRIQNQFRIEGKHKDLSESQLKEIYESQFEFVRSVMEAGKNKGVKLPYLGKFIVDKRKVNSDE